MPKTIKYTCECCGKQHDGWPALTFDSPSFYNHLSELDKANIAEINTDFCIIRYMEETSRFVRCTLTQKVNDHCEDLEYGLWASLSEKSFTDYSENFNNEAHETMYFGWLCNDIPGYDFKDSIPTTVFTRLGNQRPYIVPHEDFDHPFVKDFYNGITKQEAERRIKNMLSNSNKSQSKKAWWKLW